MKTEGNMKYYRIRSRGIIAKGNSLFNNFIFDGKDWVYDSWSIVSDRLVGYDPYEPEGSPYRFGCLSILDDLEEISFEEAMKEIGKTYPAEE